MTIHPCGDLSGVIFGIEKDEDKSNFLYLLGPGIYD